jgi:hypothetical protein
MWFCAPNLNIDNGKAEVHQALGLFSIITGAPDVANMLMVGPTDIADGAGNRLQCGQVNGNTYSALNPVDTQNLRAVQTWPYIAIHVNSAGSLAGQSCFVYAFDDEGHFMMLCNAVPTTNFLIGTSFIFGYYMRATQFSQPSANIMQGNILQSDFFRVYAQPQPPWCR